MSETIDVQNSSRSLKSGATSPVVTVHDVWKAYGDDPVLKGVSFEVRAGERLALMGPSGSGKSTLLNCLGGVDRVDSGSIQLRGMALESLGSDELSEIRRRWLGTVFQFFHLLPTLTALENVGFPLELLGVPAADRLNRSRELLERVGVAHRANAFPAELSGGEMQRVALARALVHRPPVLLADEPTGNLDSVHGQRVLELLRELTEESGTALVLVTHSEEAAAICHRCLHLLDGVIREETRNDFPLRS